MAIYSKTLDEIINYALTFEGADNIPLTAERFVIAIFDLAGGKFSISEEHVKIALETKLQAKGLLNPSTRESLLQYIADNRTLQFLDDFKMKGIMEELQKEAAKTGAGEITPDQVLEKIFANPGIGIQRCIDENRDASATETPATEPPVTETLVTETPVTEPITETVISETPTTPTPPESVTEEGTNPSMKEISRLITDTKRIYSLLSETVLGQDNAISVFTSGYFRSELVALTDEKRTRPKATFLFAGPPGVGKTYLAQTIASALELPFMCFDMSEYCDKEASIEFCGSDKVYKNGKPGNFTGFVASRPKCVVLFDEIEKAHLSIIHLFLQMLDAGRIRDNFTDEEISLKDVIMIFTTNAGKQLYTGSDSGDFSAIPRKVILKALQDDINPITGSPYFPPAICSRFASGNVVMFNQIGAHDLRNIARREVLRHAKNFEKEFSVKIDFDERVFTSILFAEGGAADARTVRSRAESFFNNELFELFRLASSEKGNNSLSFIKNIEVGIECPETNEIYPLFSQIEKPEVLIFAQDSVVELCRSKSSECNFVKVLSVKEAEDYMRCNDVKFVVLDLNCGLRSDKNYLNIEDADSDARDFFRYMHSHNASLPIYLIQTENHLFDEEEKISFVRQGVRGIFNLNDTDERFTSELREVCVKLHHQEGMLNLARANKVVSFETYQTLSEDKKSATIKLFDFKLSVAMDAEDSRNILSSLSKPNVKFDDIIGADEAKRELEYFVEYFKNPKKYIGTGVSAPKGVLLYGPPGTGKTMLAKAMASMSDATFIMAEGNQFLKKYVGEGPEMVHNLFRTARKYAPSIIFIDEIDAIAKERAGGAEGSADVANDILTAFLTEMDGFNKDKSKPVFVLAATNFSVESGTARSLDAALLRRFDRRIYIDLPKRDDRIRYMKLRASKNPAFEISEDKIKNIAIRSTGMSLAELESVFELSLRSVIRDGKIKVTDEVLDEAFETFNSGEKKSWDADTLERVARHEAGHALLCWHGGEAPSYVTVVSRANHGGYMQHSDNEGKAIYTKEELLARIRTSLGGRAAEIVCYGACGGLTTGASGDLVSATRLARSMICSYGMHPEFGLLSLDPGAELSQELRREINSILLSELEKSIAIITENREKFDRFVEELVSKNHLAGDEIKAVFEA